MKKISKEEQQVLTKYIYSISGISLDDSKDYLLESRLKPLLESYHCNTYSELYYKSKSDKTGELKEKIIDAISTNESLFFRDLKPFDLLKNKVIPDLIDRRKNVMKNGVTPLRIWSAACSYGQEVYSIGITLYEMLMDINKYDINILGTDIADEAIARASYGKYNKFEIERGMKKNLLLKYFNKVGDSWRIKDNIRMLATYKKLNLMNPLQGLGTFDIIFCRNVAIYFSKADKVKLFRKLEQSLADDGYLFLGGSENLNGISTNFMSEQYLNGIFYQKRNWAEKVKSGKKPAYTTGSQVRPVIRKPVLSSRPKPSVKKRKPVKIKPVIPKIKAESKILMSDQKPNILKPEEAKPKIDNTLIDKLKEPEQLLPEINTEIKETTIEKTSNIIRRTYKEHSSFLTNIRNKKGAGTPMSFGKVQSSKGSLLAAIRDRQSEKNKVSV